MTIYFHIYERVIVLAAAILLVFALWAAAEVYWPRWARIAAGATALLVGGFLAFIAGGALATANANVSFGVATRGLIDATVEELERGRHEAALDALRRLRDDYQVSYENRGNYETLCNDAILRMKSR